MPLWSVPFLSYIWAPSLESTQSSICHKTHSVTNGLAKCQKEQKARARLLTLWYTILHLYLPAFACMRHWHIIMGCSKNLWKIPLLFAVVQRLAKRFIPSWYWFILIYVDLCWFAWWSKKMWPPLYKPRRPSFTNLHWEGKVKNQNIQNARTPAIYSNVDIGIDHDCNIMAKHWNRNDSMRIEWDSSDSFSIWATSHVANESSQSTYSSVELPAMRGIWDIWVSLKRKQFRPSPSPSRSGPSRCSPPGGSSTWRTLFSQDM